MRRCCLLLVVSLLAIGAAGAAPMEPPLLGHWVPKEFGCRSGMRVTVSADSVVLAIDDVHGVFKGVEPCYTCEGGTKYQGIVVWAIQMNNSEGVSPFVVYFNYREQRGVTVIEFQDEELKDRFPQFDMRPMRKCRAI